jgi:lipoprotein-releasing system ATP-binding protein
VSARVVSLQGVSKDYGETPVLTDITWSISSGARYVVLGSSGSGKTTLLSMLGLLLRPSAGKVVVHGEDVWQWPEKQRAAWRTAHLGYVWQDAGLLPELTLLENVNLPLHIRGVPRSQWNGRDLLERVGLGKRLSAYPHEVSGGEGQRAGLARALAGSPKLVLADEPTGSLQRKQSEAVCELFLELQAELQFGFVVATHNEALLRYLDAEPLWIFDGRLHNKPPREEML